ncbi:MAG TPA: diacylglycerol kinase family protein [Gemmatimonadaceae bacterium]
MELLIDRVLLISNPAARRGAHRLGAVLAAFRELGVACDHIPTEHPGHAARIAVERRATEHAAVFTLGGDGTAMEVVGALAHTGVPVGILPGGTGNLVARSLGIPLDVRRAVRRLVRGTVTTVDLGVLDGGRRFAFAVGVGVDARMIAETPASAKRRFGVGAYTIAAARATLQCRGFRLRATVDGEVIEREAVMAMIANFGGVLNDLIVLGPGIRRDDGRLDLCIFSPRHAGHTLGIVWRLFRKRFGEHPRMSYRPGRSFRVECDPPQLYEADGEVLGTTPFEARVEPGASTLLLPAGRD